MMWKDLTPIEKITRCKVQLGWDKPFWAYLIMNCKFIDDSENPEIKTLCVDNRGVIYFNGEFVNTCSEEELKGVLAHEVGHVAFKHLDRLKTLNSEKHINLWNISADTIINNILIHEGFVLKEGGIIPSKNNSVTIFNVQFVELHKKSVEMVYTEM